MTDRSWALRFAEKWIAAFNSRALDLIFSLYDDNFTMTSPYIRERMGLPGGMLKGKEQIRPYWKKSLDMEPPIKFELIEVFTGISSMVIYYKSIGRRLVCETLTFNQQGKVISATSHHGPPDSGAGV